VSRPADDPLTDEALQIDHPQVVRERRRTRRFFNLVAPAFHFIDRRLLPEYRQVLADLDLPPHLSVLDMATGTGTLALAFAERGHTVAGFDFSARLLRRARRRLPHADLSIMDLSSAETIADNAHDLVVMSYLLHGLHPSLRRFALEQARRISRRYVLVFDYLGPGPLIVRFVEWIEGPHYPSFVQRPFADLAAEAGLSILVEEPVSRFAGYWLMRPAAQPDSQRS